jgi:hypothetical protein
VVKGGAGAVGVNGRAGVAGLGLTNHGAIGGGVGSPVAGIGVELSQASVYNNGYIYGGRGQPGNTVFYGNGGTGVDLTDSTLINKLGIYGGGGSAVNGSGGAGAYLSGGKLQCHDRDTGDH